MEEQKIVKLYSNNSKKARIKRRKNKFQRVWDAEKQKYVKVRKSRYPVQNKKEKKDWREIDNSSAIKRRLSTAKKVKSVPVSKKSQKKQTTQKSENKPTQVKQKTTLVRLYGKNLAWDSKTLRYKNAA